MHRIATHIEHLLLIHDCVIIPSFGGFVLQSVSGEYNADEHSFTPMWKEVVFNTALQHNDGLLTESYMQVYGVDFQKACRMLEEDVHELKSVLKHYRKATFGTVGSFTVGTEKQIIFQPNKNESFDINNYGLSTFTLPCLIVAPEEKETHAFPAKTHKRERLHIPINRRFIQTAVASAAAIGLFLLVSTPVKEVNQSAYTASFIPSEIISSTVSTPEPEPVIDLPEEVVSEEMEVVSENTLDAVAVETEKPATTFTPVEENTNTVVEIAQPEAPKPLMYHVVIASFPSEKQAKQFINQADRNRFHTIDMIYRDKKYRIYADKFDNRQEAETYIEQLRLNSAYRDAWVFTSR
ncbi:SPOR domain-containing protein [Parabacteroides sp. PF5-9]|uniref:HU domain-containing protein n=1 Tax=Parabacteroides sp. PF5-9 TaxID=1742404 RepID=UPI002474AEC7|nr:SPOR domain-containing protein [Parabacteroides sp. PF5-9]MDH6358792.1 hypothetical protein [Parabacteroides sp. PF5-9]